MSPIFNLLIEKCFLFKLGTCDDLTKDGIIFELEPSFIEDDEIYGSE